MRAEAELGHAFVIINPGSGTGAHTRSNLRREGSYINPDLRAPYYVSFVPPRPRNGDIAQFTSGTSSLSRDVQIFRINQLDTGAMIEYADILSRHVRNRRFGWDYNLVLHNCTQVVEKILSEGGY